MKTKFEFPVFQLFLLVLSLRIWKKKKKNWQSNYRKWKTGAYSLHRNCNNLKTLIQKLQLCSAICFPWSQFCRLFWVFFKFRSKVKELSEAYSESCQVYTMKLFAKVVNGFHQNIIFTKNSIIDIWQSSRYVSVELPRGHRT